MVPKLHVRQKFFKNHEIWLNIVDIYKYIVQSLEVGCLFNIYQERTT